MVELAIAIPLLAVLAVAVVDLARAYAISDHLKNAAREGAYFAATQPNHQWDDGSGTCASPNDIWDRVLTEAGSARSDLTVTVTVNGTSYTSNGGSHGTLICSPAPAPGPGTSITVSVTDNHFTLLTPIAKAIVGTVHLTGAVTVQELQ